MKRIVAFAIGVALSILAAGAHASIITVVYTGNAGGIYTDPNTSALIHFDTTATETYVFDTERGPTVETSTGFILNDPGATGLLSILDFAPISFRGNYLEVSTVGGVQTINTPLSPTAVQGFRMYVVDGRGTFQLGNCPGHFPCGQFFQTSVTITGLPQSEAAPVPLPSLGAGIPGAVLGLIFFFMLRAKKLVATGNAAPGPFGF